MAELCVIYDRECIDCGECDMCDLEPEKHCDDCSRCIDDSEEYRSVTVEDFIKQNVTDRQIKKMEKKLMERQEEQEIKQKENKSDK